MPSGAKFGHIVSEETREKIRIGHLGKKLSDEHKEKIRLYHKTHSNSGRFKKGAKLTEEHRIKIGEAQRGIKSHNWKGNEAGYGAKHNRIYRLKGKANKCVICGVLGKKRYHWANIDHKYSANPDDYVEMCIQCHRQQDFKKFGRGNIGNNQFTKK